MTDPDLTLTSPVHSDRGIGSTFGWTAQMTDPDLTLTSPLHSDRGIGSTFGWTAQMTDEGDLYELSGNDYVMDVIGETELPPGFPAGRSGFIVSERARGGSRKVRRGSSRGGARKVRRGSSRGGVRKVRRGSSRGGARKVRRGSTRGGVRKVRRGSSRGGARKVKWGSMGESSDSNVGGSKLQIIICPTPSVNRSSIHLWYDPMVP